MPETRVLIALLAAGQSKRFGDADKLDAPCAGKVLGLWAVAAVEAAGFEHRLLVTGPSRPRFAEALEGWDHSINHAPEAGLASSVRTAAQAAKGYDRLVIALADMPLMTPEHLAQLRRAGGVVFSAYPDGSRGVPAAFPARALPILASLDGSAAKADFAEPVGLIAPASPDALLDVDTREDLARIEALIEAR